MKINTGIQTDYKCSECEVLNFTETVYRENLKILRCRKCGHEKILKASGFTKSEPTVYALTKEKTIKEF